MRFIPLLAIFLLAGCGQKEDPTEVASPSAGKETFKPVTGTKSNPVANYKTAPAGQGDALK